MKAKSYRTLNVQEKSKTKMKSVERHWEISTKLKELSKIKKYKWWFFQICVYISWTRKYQNIKVIKFKKQPVECMGHHLRSYIFFSFDWSFLSHLKSGRAEHPRSYWIFRPSVMLIHHCMLSNCIHHQLSMLLAFLIFFIRSIETYTPMTILHPYMESQLFQK